MQEGSFKLRVRMMPHSSLEEVMDLLIHHLMEANVAWWEVEEEGVAREKQKQERRVSIDNKPKSKGTIVYIDEHRKETLFPGAEQ